MVHRFYKAVCFEVFLRFSWLVDVSRAAPLRRSSESDNLRRLRDLTEWSNQSVNMYNGQLWDNQHPPGRVFASDVLRRYRALPSDLIDQNRLSFLSSWRVL